MTTPAHALGPWLRRAQPLLGTLLEIGVRGSGNAEHAALAAAFEAVRGVQACLSRFDAGSDVAHFDALPRGGWLTMRTATQDVLAAAQFLRVATAGAFDISLGSGSEGWSCEGATLHKHSDAVRLDLGGIGKGYAVDCAVQALLVRGCDAGWVNAGGDLRVFGAAEMPVLLRDEKAGGVRPFATLQGGAFATSHFAPGSRSTLALGTRTQPLGAHVSVAAPSCVWADALTKVVAISGDTSHPLLARFEASAWLH